MVLEQDPEVGGPLVEQLEADGYRTAFAHTAQHARALAGIAQPALVLLGALDSPHGALELLREIRNGDAPWHEQLPVIVLGPSLPLPARSPEVLRAFAAGADDFLARPVACEQGGAALEGGAALAYLELRARLQSLLRRATHPLAPALPRLWVGPLSIDSASRAVVLRDRPIQLRPREYALLVHLAREPTRVFTKSELLRALWGSQVASCTRTLDSHACRLRAKLAAHACERWVINVRGVGYRLTSQLPNAPEKRL